MPSANRGCGCACRSRFGAGLCRGVGRLDSSSDIGSSGNIGSSGDRGTRSGFSTGRRPVQPHEFPSRSARSPGTESQAGGTGSRACASGRVCAARAMLVPLRTRDGVDAWRRVLKSSLGLIFCWTPCCLCDRNHIVRRCDPADSGLRFSRGRVDQGSQREAIMKKYIIVSITALMLAAGMSAAPVSAKPMCSISFPLMLGVGY